MKTFDLRAEREARGASREELANLAGLREGQVELWESTGRPPREHLHALKTALWGLDRDIALDKAGLPECEWVAKLREGPADSQLPAEAAFQHVESCEVCKARLHYAEEHLPPPPIGGGIVERLAGMAGWLSGWRRSAFTGAMIVLMMGGTGVVVMLGIGVFRVEPGYIAGAFGLLLLLVLSGAAGGLVHYATARLRATGTPGYYASWILTMYGYLAVIFGLLALAVLGAGREQIGELPAQMLSNPSGWLIVVVMGAFFGIVVGRGARPESPAAEVERKSTVFTAGNIFSAFVLLLMFLLRFGDRILPGGPAVAPEDRLSELRAAVGENPDDPEGQRQLGWTLLELERHDEALPVLRKAVQLNPEDADLRNSLGWTLNQFQRYGESIPVLEEALRLDPDHPEANHNLGWALLSLNRLQEAETRYSAALRIKPENARAHGELGWVRVRQGRFDDGVREYREAIRLEPANIAYRFWLADALKGRGKLEEAMVVYREAAALDPGNPVVWASLALLAHLMGRFPEALAAYERVDSLDPTVHQARPEAREAWEAAKQGRMLER